MQAPITSFRRGTPYECFSNFSDHQVVFENSVYRYSENAFQAAKTLNERLREAFQATDLTPGQAKRMGRSIILRPGWDFIGPSGDPLKVEIMRLIVHDKAIRHVNIRRTLLGTEDAHLMEGNNHGDQIWGATWNAVTGQWEGENWLGRIWMDERALLR